MRENIRLLWLYMYDYVCSCRLVTFACCIWQYCGCMGEGELLGVTCPGGFCTVCIPRFWADLSFRV